MVGPVIKGPPSNAGESSSILGWGARTPHAAGQLSPSTTTKIPSTATETRCSQINEEIFLKNDCISNLAPGVDEPAGLAPLLSSSPLLRGSLGHGLAGEGSSQLDGQHLAGNVPAALGPGRRRGHLLPICILGWGASRARAAGRKGLEGPRRLGDLGQAGGQMGLGQPGGWGPWSGEGMAGGLGCREGRRQEVRKKCPRQVSLGGCMTFMILIQVLFCLSSECIF